MSWPHLHAYEIIGPCPYTVGSAFENIPKLLPSAFVLRRPSGVVVAILNFYFLVNLKFYSADISETWSALSVPDLLFFGSIRMADMAAILKIFSR